MEKKKSNLSDRLAADLMDSVGSSGREEQAALIAIKELKKISKHLVVDNLGSAVAHISSGVKNAPKVLILGHIDEVGFIVQRIMKSGALSVLPVGGIEAAFLPGQRVKLLTRKNTLLHGAFRLTAKNAGERKTPKAVHTDIVADFGFDSKEQAARQVSIGDPIVFDSPFVAVGADKCMAKAVDDRLGVLAIIEAARILKQKSLKVDVYAGFSVQEEVGLRGGKTISGTVNPDFAIISDVSFAYDVTGGDEMGKLGAGVQIRPMDAATLQSDQITAWYKQLLEKRKIPYQYYISPGGTDAGAVHVNASGVPVLQIGLVAREIHNASSLFSRKDLQAAIKAIVSAVEDLDEARIEKFKKR